VSFDEFASGRPTKTWVDLSAISFAEFDRDDAHCLADALNEPFTVVYQASQRKWFLVEFVDEEAPDDGGEGSA